MEGRVIHNQFLQIAADNGFPGVGDLLGLFLYSFIVGLSRPPQSE